MSDTKTESEPPKNNTADDAPPTPPVLAPENAGRRSGGRTLAIIFGVLIALSVVAGVVVTMDPGWRARALAALDAVRGTSKDTTKDTTKDSAAQRVDRLSSRLTQIDGALANLRGGVPGLTARLDDVEKKIGALGTREPDAARLDRLDARIKALENRLEALAQPPATQPGPAPETLALVAFAGVLDAGRPFAPLVPLVRGALQTAGADGALADLDRLMPYAQKGIPLPGRISRRIRGLRLKPTVPESQLSPKDAAPNIGQKEVDKKEADKKDAGVWANIKARLGGLVSIRRVGDGAPSAASPSTPDVMPNNPLPNAALMIDGGDLAGALSALEALDQSRLGSEGPALMADLKARQNANHLAAALVPVIARAAALKP